MPHTQFVKVCKHCSKEFTTIYTQKIYCSKDCARDVQRPIPANLALRFRVLARDEFKCRYCGRNPLIDGVKLHIDHLVPQSELRSNKYIDMNAFDNLITACSDCNHGKSDVILDQRLIDKLKRQPLDKNQP